MTQIQPTYTEVLASTTAIVTPLCDMFRASVSLAQTHERMIAIDMLIVANARCIYALRHRLGADAGPVLTATKDLEDATHNVVTALDRGQDANFTELRWIISEVAQKLIAQLAAPVRAREVVA